MHVPGCCVDRDCTESTCMRLPDSARCGDCALVIRCEALFHVPRASTECDFYPRRFVRADEPRHPALQGGDHG